MKLTFLLQRLTVNIHQLKVIDDDDDDNGNNTHLPLL
jgi:hypothetical protein